MFNDHFYHATIRKTVAVFGTLFNNLNVVRKNKDGTIADITKVPLSYGPRQKFLDRVNEMSNLDNMKVGIKLPRLSFEISAISYDSATANTRYNKIKIASNASSNTVISNYVPYTINMDLNIMAKNQDDALQILEQIIPTFAPTYTLAVNYIEGAPSIDVPITLEGVSLADEYEGDFNSRRVLVYTLSFSIKTKFFGSESEVGVIQKTFAGLYNSADNSHLETLGVKAYSEEEDDSTNIVLGNKEALLNYYDFEYGRIVTMEIISNADLNISVDEIMYGSDSLSEGTVVSSEKILIDEDTYKYVVSLRDCTSYFRINEEMVSTANNLIGNVLTYTVE